MARRRECPSGKVRHASIEEAAEAIRDNRRRGLAANRSYRCRTCGGFHLTSKPILGAPKAA